MFNTNRGDSMREILFRGKDIKGNWHIGLLAHIGNAWYISNKAGVATAFEVIPETVGQYTGLTDKNGKRIFKGDIVKADDYIFVVKYGKCGGVANADNYGYIGFYLKAFSEATKLNAKYGLRDDICYFDDIEVIGNVHDNHELLKEEPSAE